MLRYSVFLFVLLFAVAFSSCNKIPEHAGYIPKDAMVVVGINTKELSKKLAWNVLMGSKLLEELKTKTPENGQAAEGLGDAGIDALNTVFFYYTPSFAKGSYQYLTAIIPLSDAKKWEGYIQKNFTTSIKQSAKQKEALLEEGLYAAWNDETAIVRKAYIAPPNKERMTDEPNAEDVNTPHNEVAGYDAAKLSADMQAAFTLLNENSITKDKRFSKLQTGGDDITLWMNYEVLMNNMNNYNSMGMMGGLALGNNLWKDAAYAAGINLDKGAVHADMHYYVSEEMMKVYAKMGNKEADKNMIDRLPSQQLNMLASAHVSPEGIKASLEKMGILGFMSLALVQSNLTTDDVFQSFTGDMAMALNNFSIRPAASNDSSPVAALQDDWTMNYLFALKINDNEKCNKLLGYIKEQGMLMPIDATTYQFAGNDALYVSIDKEFMVISRKAEAGKDFLNGTHTAQPKPEIIKKEIYGHPTGMYIDIQSFLNHITVSPSSAEENEVLNESKKLFKEIVINGGEHRKEAFAFKAVLKLMNREENSLLQLLDYSFKINEIRKHYEKKEHPAETAAPLAAKNASLN